MASLEALWTEAETDPALYGPRREFTYLLKKYGQTYTQSSTGKDTLIDIGCGPHPFSDILASPGCQRILVDTVPYVHQHTTQPDTPLTVQADLNHIVEHTNSARNRYQHALRETGEDSVDGIIAARVLGYMDYQAIFHWMDQHLTPGGRIFTLEQFIGENIVGASKHFHEDRPRTRDEVVKFFTEDLGYEAEAQHEMITASLVARKPV